MNEEIIQNLNERLDRAIDKGRSILADEDLQKKVEEVKNQAEHTIKEHPLLSVAAGLAIGFILARLFRSND